MALLDVHDLSIRFGGLTAVDHITFHVDSGEIMGLIGPNGAGKTTVFNLLTSVYRPTTGDIRLKGKSLVGGSPWDAVNLGLCRTFQNIRLFKHMSVLDNVRVGFQNQGRYGLISALLRLPSYWTEEKRYEQRGYELLELFDLAHDAQTEASALPYGKQRKLEIARALATSPQILLLDEPAAGMNPTETQDLMQTIRSIRDRFEIAVVLIEHDMNLVMNVCERLTVLNYGQILAQGTPQEIRHDPRVIEAYLGTPTST